MNEQSPREQVRRWEEEQAQFLKLLSLADLAARRVNLATELAQVDREVARRSWTDDLDPGTGRPIAVASPWAALPAPQSPPQAPSQVVAGDVSWGGPLEKPAASNSDGAHKHKWKPSKKQRQATREQKRREASSGKAWFENESGSGSGWRK